MTKKTKRCPTCKGNKIKVYDYQDGNGKPHSVELPCDNCGGSGRVEKKKNIFDLIFNKEK